MHINTFALVSLAGCTATMLTKGWATVTTATCMSAAGLYALHSQAKALTESRLARTVLSLCLTTGLGGVALLNKWKWTDLCSEEPTDADCQILSSSILLAEGASLVALVNAGYTAFFASSSNQRPGRIPESYSVGGYTNLADLSNEIIKATILSKLPNDTYTNVEVESTSYTFSTVSYSRSLKAKKITLHPPFSIFGYFFNDESHHCFRLTALKNLFFVANFDPTQGRQEIQQAYSRRKTIIIWISEDCKEIEIQLS